MLRDAKTPDCDHSPSAHNLANSMPLAESAHHATELVVMAEELRNIALSFGVGLTPQWLGRLEIELQCKDDPFRRGVLTTVAQLIDKLAQRPEGRKALADLGFEPVFQYVERPGGTGLDQGGCDA